MTHIHRLLSSAQGIVASCLREHFQVRPFHSQRVAGLLPAHWQTLTAGLVPMNWQSNQLTAASGSVAHTTQKTIPFMKQFRDAGKKMCLLY